MSSHKSHQKSTVTSKGCPSGHSRLPYSLVFLTKGQDDFPSYSLTPKYTTDKDRRLCDLCKEKTFSSHRFLENRQKLRFFQKEPHFCYKNQISPLVRLIICQNLRSFGQETTEISPFDPLIHSNKKRNAFLTRLKNLDLYEFRVKRWLLVQTIFSILLKKIMGPIC